MAFVKVRLNQAEQVAPHHCKERNSPSAFWSLTLQSNYPFITRLLTSVIDNQFCNVGDWGRSRPVGQHPLSPDQNESFGLLDSNVLLKKGCKGNSRQYLFDAQMKSELRSAYWAEDYPIDPGKHLSIASVFQPKLWHFYQAV